MDVNPVPDAYGSVTVSLTVSPCDEAIEFYKSAFGAEEATPPMIGPDGKVSHAEIRIGDTIVMLSDEQPDSPTKSPRSAGTTTAVLFLYTEDVDSLWERAIALGAREVYPLSLQFYGDKGGRVEDPFGHQWGLAQHVEDVSPDEMERRIAEFYEASREERQRLLSRELGDRPD
ncbi:MAG TPA: VOC family protein [Acidimicrobiia bacterium]|nr:VOC family protein [Acidimicrobiia bacterium]